MKKIIASACFFALAVNLAAFDLPAMNAGALRGASAPQAPAASPAKGLEDDMPHGSIPADEPAWSDLRAAFFRAQPPADLHGLLGVYKGHLHPLAEREDYTVPFEMTIYRDPATGAVKAVFPLYDSPEIITLKMTKFGAEFADAWEGRARLVIRVAGGKLYMFSNLYSDETYGVAEPERAAEAAAGRKGGQKVLAVSYSNTFGKVLEISPNLFVMNGEVFTYFRMKDGKDVWAPPMWFRRDEVRFENQRVTVGGRLVATCYTDGHHGGSKCDLRPGFGISYQGESDRFLTAVIVSK